MQNNKVFKNCKILKLNDIETFKFMTRCKGGILSPSTFAWWASYFSYKLNKNKKTFFAPNYWAGFKKKKFYPKSFKKSNYLNFVDVKY